MKLIKLIIPLVIGVLFIVSAVLKLYPIEMLELDLGRHLKLPEWLSMIFARLLIGFEIALGLLLMIPRKNNRVLHWALGTTLFFSVYLVYLIVYFPSVENCGCMGMMVRMTPEESLIKNLGIVLLILFQLYFKKQDFMEFSFFSKRIQFVLVLISGLTPFLLNSVELDKIELRQKLSANVNKELLKAMKSDDQNEVLLMYLSPHCVFCKMLAQKWMWFNERNHWNVQVHAVFMGEKIEGDIQLFLSQTGLRVDSYESLNAIEFIQRTNGSLPSVYLVQNDEVVQKDNFISFNEKNLQGLLSR
jgi:hypothetical protein